MKHPTFPKISVALADSARGSSDWVATEKIHGAQLVVATSEEGVRIGKRKAWLEPEQPFFGWQLIAPLLREAAKSVSAAVRCERVVIYGELCGGAYPHPDVAAVPGLNAVQTGVWYAPDLQYIVFDIRIYPAHNGDEDDSEFLGDDEVRSASQKAGLQTVPLLGRGKRATLRRLPVRFPSKLAALLGLPPIDGNDAEGFVLKPAMTIAAAQRPLVKHKIPEFDDAKFDESVPLDVDAQLSLHDLLKLCGSLANRSRVASARSKVGADPAAIRDEMILDVLVDLESVFPRRMKQLTVQETQTLHEHLGKLAADLVS